VLHDRVHKEMRAYKACVMPSPSRSGNRKCYSQGSAFQLCAGGLFLQFNLNLCL
jgi:hypothetical protein